MRVNSREVLMNQVFNIGGLIGMLGLIIGLLDVGPNENGITNNAKIPATTTAISST